MNRTRSDSAIRLEEVLDNTLDGVFIVDSERRFQYFNAACERITGYAREELTGSQCECCSVMECADEQGRRITAALCPGLQILKGESASTRQRMRLRRKDGSFAWVEKIYTALKDEKGDCKCVIAVLRNISEAKRQDDELRSVTENLREEVASLRAELENRYGFSGMISRSPSMQEVFERMRAACTNRSAVLICGEPGTGKERIARTIHHNGLQKEGRLLVLKCSSLSRDQLEGELFGYGKGAGPSPNAAFEGLFRAAEGGTLYLDEITEMPSDTQAKLARALEEGRARPVGSADEFATNVRVIASSSRSVSEAVGSGWLRRDLYYLLSVISIETPRLREHKRDIPFLVEHFVNEFNTRSMRQVRSIHPHVWPILLHYDWPGDVRELRNAIETAIAMGSGPELQASSLPSVVRGEAVDVYQSDNKLDLPLDELLASVERRAILSALRRAGGQRSRAARAMGVSRSRLYRRMESLGIHPREDL